MVHNFPKGVTVICKEKHTLTQIKEIMHLCIDNGLSISSTTIRQPVTRSCPYMGISGNTLFNYRKLQYNVYHYVSFNEFKAFCIGKGKYKKPYSKELKLNYSYKAIITKTNIQVGCQSFSHDIIKKLYEESQKALKSK